ncbi:DUF6308 family protein [Geodermatophilus sp. SYSU D01062]
MTTRSIAELEGCARRHLAEYTDLTGSYAFATYDHWWGRSPDRITPAEVYMANCLSLRLSAREVSPLFAAKDSPAMRLRDAMQLVLDRVPSDGSVRFEDLASIDDEPLRLFRDACKATERRMGQRKVRGWNAVQVSKVLHRLRPHVVPIVDSVVRRFYGGARAKLPSFYRALHEDLRANREWLETRAVDHSTPDGREPSLLRTADIIIWTHHDRRCPGGG